MTDDTKTQTRGDYAALRRQVDQQKSMLKVATRSYEAASGGRLNPTQSWFALSSADAQLYGQDRILRETSRDLYQNNPYYKSGVEGLVANMIGEGIVPKPVTGNKKKDLELKKLFKQWSKRAACDMDGQMDFYGLQTQVAFQLVTAGEVLLRKAVPERSAKGYVVPLKIQLLEADYLDSYRTGLIDNGNVTIQGIEIATQGPDMGTRAAYWLYPQHPGTIVFGANGSFVSKPVPANEILHVYDKKRTQARGVPWGVSCFNPLKNLAEYELAEIVRKRTESCVAAIVTTEDDSEIGLNRVDPNEMRADLLADVPAGVYDIYNNPIEYLTPGLIAYARGGKQITFTSPSTSGGYSEYKTSQLQSIAAGLGVPYEIMTPDMSNVSFISGRLGLLDFRKKMKIKQKQLLVPTFLQPIWEWFCEAAFVAGLIETPFVDVEWQFPAYEYIDPVAEVSANNSAIRSGQRSWQDVIASGGRDPDVVFEEIVSDFTRNREFGISLDSDPGAVSGRGVAQKNAPGQDAPSGKKDKKKKKKKNKDGKAKSKVKNLDALPHD